MTSEVLASLLGVLVGAVATAFVEWLRERRGKIAQARELAEVLLEATPLVRQALEVRTADSIRAAPVELLGACVASALNTLPPQAAFCLLRLNSTMNALREWPTSALGGLLKGGDKRAQRSVAEVDALESALSALLGRKWEKPPPPIRPPTRDE